MDPCPECGASQWTFDARRDEWTCGVCGLAVDALTVHGAPQAGSGPTRRLGPVERRALGISGSEHRLQDAQAEALRVATAVGCPIDVAERAAAILKRARKAGLTQGRPLDALAAAALQAACRMLFLTRTPQELAAASKADGEQIQAAYKALVAGLRLPVPAMSAQEYMGQLASKAELPQALVGPARERLLPICGTARAAGKSPIGWAAAALYLEARQAGVKTSANRIAKAAGISGSTLAARVAELEA